MVVVFFSEARKKQGTLERVCLNSQVIKKFEKNFHFI